jgi:hypothetical protein
MRMTNQMGIGVAYGSIESLDEWMKIRATRQVAEYIHELTAELTRMARSAECGALASLLQVASLEAKKQAREHGCEALLNAVDAEPCNDAAWAPTIAMTNGADHCLGLPGEG